MAHEMDSRRGRHAMTDRLAEHIRTRAAANLDTAANTLAARLRSHVDVFARTLGLQMGELDEGARGALAQLLRDVLLQPDAVSPELSPGPDLHTAAQRGVLNTLLDAFDRERQQESAKGETDA